MTYRNREHLIALADRCDKGAEQLAYDGEHAAEVLADRGWPNADAEEWAGRKQAAAASAREYAAGLRAEAVSMNEGDRLSEERIRQAERVADAAELGGGILIDGRRLAEATAQSGSVFDRPARESWEAGTHPAQQKACQIEATGVFQHVAETINGVPQVPYWQLGASSQARTQTADDTADDCDEM
jgi:hypothetical protein